MAKLNVNIGDIVIAKNGKSYFFTHDALEEFTPYAQVDAKTFEVVDLFPVDVFKKVGLGHKLYIGGEIIDIIHHDDRQF